MFKVKIAIEQAKHYFSPFNGYERFFGKEFPSYNRKKTLSIPYGHELMEKIKTIQVLDLEQKDTITSQLILIEDSRNQKSMILVSRDDFTPANRADVVGCEHGETSSHVVYGNAATVGSIQFFEKGQALPFARAKDISSSMVTTLTEECKESGIRSKDVSNPVQLSGSHVIVAESNENTNAVLAFLLGSAGPLNDIVVFPENGQEELLNQIRIEGGRSLLSVPVLDENHVLALSKFDEIRQKVKNKTLLAQIPYLLSIHQGKLKVGSEMFKEIELDLVKYLLAELKLADALLV